MTATRTTAVAPPPRRGGPTVVETTQVQVHSSGGQAKAVYDYSSGDSGDLSVQSGQVVNIVEKTSEDCKPSFHPALGSSSCVMFFQMDADGRRVDM